MNKMEIFVGALGSYNDKTCPIFDFRPGLRFSSRVKRQRLRGRVAMFKNRINLFLVPFLKTLFKHF